MDIPEYAKKKIEIIAKKNEIEEAEILTEYEKKFNSDFVSRDPQFDDDESRHKYVSGWIWGEYINKPKVEPVSIIPIGVSPIGKSKTTSLPYCSVFALDKREKLRRISFGGNAAFNTKNINYWNLYKDVKLQSFKDSLDLRADERATFDDPQPLDGFDRKSILDKLKIPIINPSQASENLSNKDSTGYTDSTDWKAIRGYIKYESSTNYEDGDFGEWGRYTITGGGDDALVSKDGSINTRGFSVRVSPTMMNYPKDSECYFLGTIGSFVSKKTKETIYTMDCYTILPIIIMRD